MKKLESVLLVDDDEITNFINEQLIKDLSVAEEILVATNGKEGIDAVEKRCQDKKSCPELILLDINMPVMNGFEFLEKYQQMYLPHRPKSVVVMLTSSENSKDIEKSKQTTIADYMTKPLTEKKISSILEKYF
jgi:CheY-like chemotaxis protein